MNFGLGMPSISPTVLWSLAAIGIGFGLLFLMVKGLGGGRMLRVPDGEAPDKFFRDWQASPISKRIGRAAIFVTIASLGMMLGGCGGLVVGFVAR